MNGVLAAIGFGVAVGLSWRVSSALFRQLRRHRRERDRARVERLANFDGATFEEMWALARDIGGSNDLVVDYYAGFDEENQVRATLRLNDLGTELSGAGRTPTQARVDMLGAAKMATQREFASRPPRTVDA